MKGAFKIENIDDIVCELTLSMTVKQWRELQQQLADKHPSWQLSSIITDLFYELNTKAFNQVEMQNKE